jgi:hypothetical protein
MSLRRCPLPNHMFMKPNPSRKQRNQRLKRLRVRRLKRRLHPVIQLPRRLKGTAAKPRSATCARKP